MSTRAPETIVASNLSLAWGQAFSLAMNHGVLPPLMISVDEFIDCQPAERLDIRTELDATLKKDGKYLCDESALTIFPYRHWIREGKPPREELFDWYLRKFLPRLKARDQRNRYGTYFERMIDFHGSKKKGASYELHSKNQLDQIIYDWTRDRDRPRRPRQSALQAACLDPTKDLTHL